MELVSRRKFARDNNVSVEAICKHVRAGRLPSTNGKIDPAIAQPIWDRIKDPGRAGKRRNKPTAQKGSSAGIPEPVAPSSDSSHGQSRSYDDARTRREYLRAEREAIELEKLKGTLVAAIDVRRQIDGMIHNVRGRLLSLGHRLAPKVAIEQDRGRCKELIDDVVREVLLDLAAYQGDQES
jgi:hypothetical protein